MQTACPACTTPAAVQACIFNWTSGRGCSLLTQIACPAAGAFPGSLPEGHRRSHCVHSCASEAAEVVREQCLQHHRCHGRCAGDCVLVCASCCFSAASAQHACWVLLSASLLGLMCVATELMRSVMTAYPQPAAADLLKTMTAHAVSVLQKLTCRGVEVSPAEHWACWLMPALASPA